MICAHAVSVDLKRVSGSEAVDVSLNRGVATVKLKPGNPVTPEEFWQAIRKDGFTPRETHVIVKGVIEGTKLKVTGTNQVYDLAGDPEAPKAIDEASKLSGSTATIEGRLMPPKDFKSKVPILIHALLR